jgi:hypothetical protein
MSECRVCGIEHSAELHAAVLRVRAWFRTQVVPKPVTARAPRNAWRPAITPGVAWGSSPDARRGRR